MAKPRISPPFLRNRYHVRCNTVSSKIRSSLGYRHSNERRSGNIFAESSSAAPENPTNSQPSEPPSSPGSISTTLTDPVQEESREIIDKPPVDSWGAMGRRPGEPTDDLRESQHGTQNPQPPLSALPVERQVDRLGDMRRRPQEPLDGPRGLRRAIQKSQPPPIAPPVERQMNRLGDTRRQSQEPQDDLREFQHVTHNSQPFPPPPKQKPFRTFRAFKAKLRELFGRPRRPH